MAENTVKHQPATPLPWLATTGTAEYYRFDQRRLIQTIDGQRNVAKLDAHESREPDARYIAHAANAYPKLIAELQWRVSQDPNRISEQGNRARALLAELGEEA